MEKEVPKVRRITIDERLSEDLIRVEICELIRAGESGEFQDGPDYWKDIAREGEEVVARSSIPEKEFEKDFYVNLMGIPRSQVEQFPWKDFKEGQVFLSGEFKVKKERIGDKDMERFFVAPGKKAFQQIDDDVKENTKALYYEILAKGEKIGKL